MNQTDLNTLLNISKSKIDKGLNFNNIKEFIVSFHNEEIFLKLEDEIKQYFEIKKNVTKKNRKYWMVLCNPLKWKEDTKSYMVNELLFNLTQDRWKVNSSTVCTSIKKGDLGIIKVSKDNRKLLDRTDKNNIAVNVLDAGIYAVFEVILDGCSNKNDFGESFIQIKIINNLYAKNQNIMEQESLKLLNENSFMSSKKIDKFVFDNILRYIENH